MTLKLRPAFARHSVCYLSFSGVGELPILLNPDLCLSAGSAMAVTGEATSFFFFLSFPPGDTVCTTGLIP